MSEWHDSQKRQSGNLRKLLLQRLEKTKPCRAELATEEKMRLAKLEAIAERLKRDEGAWINHAYRFTAY